MPLREGVGETYAKPHVIVVPRKFALFLEREANQRDMRRKYRNSTDKWRNGYGGDSVKPIYTGLLAEYGWHVFFGVDMDFGKFAQERGDFIINGASCDAKGTWSKRMKMLVRVDHNGDKKPDYYLFAHVDVETNLGQPQVTLRGMVSRNDVERSKVEKGYGDFSNYVVEDKALTEPKQARRTLFHEVSPQMIRYPGGKGKIAGPIISEFPAYSAGDMFAQVTEYREPFFGAGAIGLNILESLSPTIRVWLNDRDPGIFALWKTIASRTAVHSLIEKVSAYVPAAEDFYRFKEIDGADDLDMVTRAFHKIVLHQISFSGLGAMAGSAIGGRSQGNKKYSVGVRWNAATLRAKLLMNHKTLVKFGKNLKITGGDFEEVIGGASERCIIYADPPYWTMGPVLYKVSMSQSDHSRLARCMRASRSKSWFVSYDDCPEVRDLYQWASIQDLTITGTINGCRKNKEILIRRERR